MCGNFLQVSHRPNFIAYIHSAARDLYRGTITLRIASLERQYNTLHWILQAVTLKTSGCILVSDAYNARCRREIKVSMINAYLVLHSVFLCLISDVRETTRFNTDFSDSNSADWKVLMKEMDMTLLVWQTYVVPDRVVRVANFKTMNIVHHHNYFGSLMGL